uniref:BREX-1 system adenine-specific DNA-methyltransferase PglX n=1 Tax=Prevotella sp. TaxID=59823 RepID=UPI003FEED252
MDTNRIKRFATEARNILKAGIAAKITTLGFDKNGFVAEEHRPQLMQGGALWNEQLQTEGFYYQWMSLYNRIQQKGINEVYEEAAYTWFNRLCAIRILQKNNLCSPVLAYADAARTPVIVDEARQGRIPQMKEELRQRLVELLDDDTKVTEQFAILITAWCHDNPIINKCFGSIADYTELLLPNNILAEGGFVDMLNHTEFINDEDFKSPELIGWLYQFYIAERKDEVFAKKGKFEADEIPAATQIFTPNWIVKYMVQNTVGRIYLDNNPYETQLQKKWQYLVEPSEKPSNDIILNYNELEDIKVADLACGSGHILNECFDLLYDLYIAEGYGRGEAVENIFSHNLTGIDLDTRAKQLSQFALLLKACQKDAAFADAHCMPNVLTMPKPWNEETQGPIQDMLHIYFQGEATNGQKEDIIDCFDLMQDADSLGSIMKFDISESTRLLIKQTTDYWCNQEIVPEEVRTQILAFKMILALTEKYHALVMNPPYMGGSKMNSILSKYVKDNYEESKADLFSVFMQMGMKRLIFNGKMAQINMQSWMFLSSFEKLRTQLLKNYNIDNMLHLGPRTFDELSGEVVQNTAFVLSKHKPTEQGGVYFRLVEGKNCADKEQLFLSHINGNEDGNRIYYPNVEQKNFEKIPGAPIGYWVSPKIQEIFTSNLALSAVASPCVGLQTADNARFLRLWFEPSYSRIGFGCENAALAARSQKKWFPCNKGGGQRKWYGNQSEVIDWENDGEAIKNFPGAVIRNEHCYFKESVTWNMISSGNLSFRFFPKGSILNNASNAICEGDLSGLLGYLNSPITIKIANLINPTLNLSNGVVAKFPYLNVNTETYRNIVKQNVAISKSDWDAHETSWDFQRNELLSIDTSTYTANIDYKIEKHFEETGERINLSPAAPKLGSLEWRMEQYKTKWERKFMQLHKNEEELNRQFIDIYGLQDELTPDVQLSEITILQQGEIKITDQYSLCDNDGSIFTDSDGAILTVTGDSYLEWQDDVIMKQLISYAVGCMLGRYRLDKPGLHIAHPNPTDDEIAPYEYKGEQWEIDDDGIMPLMPNDCGFSDNASARFADFIRVALGNEDHVANLNYVEQCLGKTLEQYFVKDFWKDHKKMYQNRPIYWLFSSKKGAFQVIAYMHRMNAYTAERVRSKYLLPYIEHLEAEIDKLDARRAELSTKETKQLQALQKQLDECREYHERLQVVAEQAISFDLDDGVVVNYAKFGDILQKIK